MTLKNFLLISNICLFCFCSCSETNRFDINSDDTIPPAAPIISRYEALNGAVRIFYTPPEDTDIISIDALYTRKSDGETFRFSSSYFSNSILVNGLADTVTYEVQLYAVDRAGNQSPKILYSVKPLESVILKVKRTIVVKSGFDAIFVKWTNDLANNGDSGDLGEPVNVYIDYAFTMDGANKNLTRVFTSTVKENRYYISDLNIPPDSPIKVKYRISDKYGNFTDEVDMGNLFVLKDVEVPKIDANGDPLWYLPENDAIPLAEYGNTVRQVFGDNEDGRLARVIDGDIDENENLNYLYSNTGWNWNLLIDFNDYYELSRILTHQRHTKTGEDDEIVKRGNYYGQGNVGQYRMYRWAEELDPPRWDTISFHKIEIPRGVLSELDWNKLGRAGDMAYMYPDDPSYTKPTRWFRYEAISGFNDGYTAAGNCLSEVTFYCKQK
jgi:hypothetical protein